MQIQSTRFGTLEIEPDRIITFPEGVPGFEDKRFILLTPEDTAPFCWLQSVDSPEVAFVVSEPSVFLPDYKPEIPDSVYQELECTADDEILILVVLVIPEDIKKMTANLAAPIVINVEKRLAKQEILSTGDYPLRYNLYESLYGKGGNA